MIRRYANWIIAAVLVTLVAGACIVRTRPVARGRPVYVQPGHAKHKHQKHNHGRGHGNGKHKKH